MAIYIKAYIVLQIIRVEFYYISVAVKSEDLPSMKKCNLHRTFFFKFYSFSNSLVIMLIFVAMQNMLTKKLLAKILLIFCAPKMWTSEEMRALMAIFPSKTGENIILQKAPHKLFVCCVWLPLLFLGMEVRHERQFTFMPSI